MLRVWVDGKPVGLLDRFGPGGSTFVYDAKTEARLAVSLTMPIPGRVLEQPNWIGSDFRNEPSRRRLASAVGTSICQDAREL
jgi:HipA N-terminal domain